VPVPDQLWSSPDEKTQSTVKLSRAGRLRWGESGNLPGWQLCRGMGGRLRLESVATLVWNTHVVPVPDQLLQVHPALETVITDEPTNN